MRASTLYCIKLNIYLCINQHYLTKIDPKSPELSKINIEREESDQDELKFNKSRIAFAAKIALMEA